jgi:hypothetical protein
MSTDADPEHDRLNGKLNPEFYSRLYPSGWDLSEHCSSREVPKPVEAFSEVDDQACAGDIKPAPEAHEPFPYHSSPRIFHFPSGMFYIHVASDPF